MKNTGIRSKLLSAFFTTIFLLTSLNIFFGVMHFRIVGEYQKITDNMFLEYRLMGSVTKMTQLHYVLIKNVVNDLSLRKYRESQREVRDLLETLNTSLVGKESRISYRGLRNLIQSIDVDCETSLQDAQKGDAQKGLEIYTLIKNKDFYVHENVVTLILKELDQANVLRGQFQKTHLVVLITGMFLLFFVTTGCVIFIFIFSERLVAPLVRLSHLAEHIAGGDLSGGVDQGLLERKDELGSLSSSFNRMMVNLRQNISARELSQKELLEAYDKLKDTKNQLLQSEKMASIGQLAAGVAHEINNPIGFISNNMEIFQGYVQNYRQILRVIEQVKMHADEGDIAKVKSTIDELRKLEKEIELDYMMNDVNTLLEHSSRGLERIEKIVLDLRTFAREDKTENMELIKVEEVIDSILSIVQSELKYKAEVTKEYGKTSLVKGNAQRLGQVFINLLLNASQAIKEKGKVIIKTYQQDKYVCVDITDTGHGIAEKDLKKIFDPFFTTKPVGQGTGLGLSVSYEIIKKHGGDIQVRSKPGEGTTFTVRLPL